MMGGCVCAAYRITGNDEIRDSHYVRDSPNKLERVRERILHGYVWSKQGVLSIIL